MEFIASPIGEGDRIEVFLAFDLNCYKIPQKFSCQTTFNRDLAPVRTVSSPNWKSVGGVAIDPMHMRLNSVQT
jgi:hypothetical protein